MIKYIMDKYTVYRNDIKYREHRNIDMSRALWTDDIKKDYINKNTDGIDYRIEDCKREKYETLDISHIERFCFKELFLNEIFKTIKNKIQHIFAQDCGLIYIPNLTELSNLQTLDISSV